MTEDLLFRALKTVQWHFKVLNFKLKFFLPDAY